MVKKKKYSLIGAVQLILALLLAIGGYSQSFASVQESFSSDILTSGDNDHSDELWISYPYSADTRQDTEPSQYPPLEEDSDDNKTEENPSKIHSHGYSLYELTLLQRQLLLKLTSLRLIFIDYQALVPLYVLFHSWKNFLS